MSDGGRSQNVRLSLCVPCCICRWRFLTPAAKKRSRSLGNSLLGCWTYPSAWRAKRTNKSCSPSSCKRQKVECPWKYCVIYFDLCAKLNWSCMNRLFLDTSHSIDFENSGLVKQAFWGESFDANSVNSKLHRTSDCKQKTPNGICNWREYDYRPFMYSDERPENPSHSELRPTAKKISNVSWVSFKRARFSLFSYTKLVFVRKIGRGLWQALNFQVYILSLYRPTFPWMVRQRNSESAYLQGIDDVWG